jgi:hypothetical protein
MSRRARCRCGAVLRFEKGPNGYKTRCPGCGSVVRLRPAMARSTGRAQRSVTCPCGAAVAVPKGMRKTNCPVCQRELLLSKKSSRSRKVAKSIQASQGPQEPPAPDIAPSSPSHQATPRTVACEVCRKVVSARASHCPGCGSSLDRTTAARSLQAERSAVPSFVKTVVRKSSPHKLVFGWMVAGAGLLVAAALILWLRH